MPKATPNTAIPILLGKPILLLVVAVAITNKYLVGFFTNLLNLVDFLAIPWSIEAIPSYRLHGYRCFSITFHI
jgi:hypothetical protein